MNQDVVVKLKNNAEYKGTIIDCDGHMNVILEGAIEYKANEATANFGRVIVRGNNVLYICIESPGE
jgi:small nuclear ribonucleoprotein